MHISIKIQWNKNTRTLRNNQCIKRPHTQHQEVSNNTISLDAFTKKSNKLFISTVSRYTKVNKVETSNGWLSICI